MPTPLPSLPETLTSHLKMAKRKGRQAGRANYPEIPHLLLSSSLLTPGPPLEIHLSSQYHHLLAMQALRLSQRWLLTLGPSQPAC